MKILKLTKKNVFKNKSATMLTILGNAICLFLFCALIAASKGLNTIAKNSVTESLVMVYEKAHSIPIFTNVPVKYCEQIKQNSNVIDATPLQFYIAPYKDKEDQQFIRGVIPTKYYKFKDFKVVEGNLKDFEMKKNGGLVGSRLAKKYGWKVGQEVMFLDDVFSFVVTGIISNKLTTIEEEIIVRLDYLQDILNKPGSATCLYVKVNDPAKIDLVVTEIDSTFSNYPVKTRSFSEKTVWKMFMSDIDPLYYFFTILGYIGIFVSALATLNSISITVRNRTKDIAILRVLGFNRMHVLTMIMSESFIISITGGIVGCILAYFTFGKGNIIIDIPPQSVPLIVNYESLIAGFIAIIFISICGGIVPAIRASNINIISAVREVQ